MQLETRVETKPVSSGRVLFASSVWFQSHTTLFRQGVVDENGVWGLRLPARCFDNNSNIQIGTKVNIDVSWPNSSVLCQARDSATDPRNCAMGLRPPPLERKELRSFPYSLVHWCNLFETPIIFGIRMVGIEEEFQ